MKLTHAQFNVALEKHFKEAEAQVGFKEPSENFRFGLLMGMLEASLRDDINVTYYRDEFRRNGGAL